MYKDPSSVRVDLLSDFELDHYNEWVDRNEEKYAAYNLKTTTCILKLKNGFEVVGTSGCEDPSKFDEVLGRTYALKDALRKLGEFAAFYRAQVALVASTRRIEAKSSFTDEQLAELRRLWKQQAESFQIVGHPMVSPTANMYEDRDAILTGDTGTVKLNIDPALTEEAINVRVRFMGDDVPAAKSLRAAAQHPLTRSDEKTPRPTDY